MLGIDYTTVLEEGKPHTLEGMWSVQPVSSCLEPLLSVLEIDRQCGQCIGSCQLRLHYGPLRTHN